MTEPEEPKQEDNSRVIPRIIQDEMKQSFLDYAMSVIVDRALPDVRDGLKPVHRRVLFGAKLIGLSSDKSHKKSARLVGEILGRLHPHGDQAVYETTVRMAQDFSLRYTLIDGQGNFGSIDGDSAAAMRYTEVRLTKMAEEMLLDIDKETVNFVDNFDGSLQEPTVLPSKIPNLLINGSSGIAVGMATNIPPHNLTEVCETIIRLIDNSNIPDSEIYSIIKGPDFPTGGIIFRSPEMINGYNTGRGKVIIRSKTKVEEVRGRERIIVSEIPYQVNKSALIEEIVDAVKDTRIQGISDIRDESDRDGMRIVIEIKQNSNAELVLNQLFKHSRLQTSFGINTIALVDGKPQTLGIRSLLKYFIEHRKSIVIRRTQFELKKAYERLHILEGLIIALDNIDDIIEKIKKSKSANDAKEMLMNDYSLSEIQSKAILDIRLQRLAAMEQDKIRTEHKETTNLIISLESILADESKIFSIIKEETTQIMNQYGDSRRTSIAQETMDNIAVEDLIKEETVVITYTFSGYIKRIPLSEYRQQNRGGKGVTAAGMKEDDFVEDIFISSSHDHIMLFTNKGKVYWLKAYEIPPASRQSKGKHIINVVDMDKEEKVTAILSVKKFDETHFILMATAKGTIKKTNLIEYSNPRKTGIAAIKLEEADNLVNVKLTDGKQEVILATRNGLAIRFKEEDVRTVGRVSQGVRGCKLKDKDYVIGMEICDEKTTLLTVTEKGYGKRSLVSDYRLINRGGSGVINLKTTDKNGKVVAVKAVLETDELMCISRKGIAIRVPVHGISIIGRATQGVRIMKLPDDDFVVSCAKIASEAQPIGETIPLNSESK